MPPSSPTCRLDSTSHALWLPSGHCRWRSISSLWQALSAPVIGESGGDRNAMTEGTRVLSDRLIVRISADRQMPHFTSASSRLANQLCRVPLSLLPNKVVEYQVRDWGSESEGAHTPSAKMAPSRRGYTGAVS